jgi:hypothetical protein
VGYNIEEVRDAPEMMKQETNGSILTGEEKF